MPEKTKKAVVVASAGKFHGTRPLKPLISESHNSDTNLIIFWYICRLTVLKIVILRLLLA